MADSSIHIYNEEKTENFTCDNTISEFCVCLLHHKTHLHRDWFLK